LVELEVGTIIDLREPGEKLPSEGAEKRAATAAQIEYIPEPMPGLGAPSRDAVKRILSVLSDPGREKPVFIHCRRGSDRTGTVVAIYRITHDCWTADRAIQEAKEKGMFWFELGMRKLIREWYEEIKAQSCEERRQSISRRVAARRLAP
jgi:protein-tyrosine phosphatase